VSRLARPPRAATDKIDKILILSATEYDVWSETEEEQGEERGEEEGEAPTLAA
jgi:hypothetical protein